MTSLATASAMFRAHDETVSALQTRLEGALIAPDDPRYEEARLAWNRSVDQRPALILIAASPGDVAEAVRFARRHGLGIAVQSTGHGLTLAADGALLVITSQLKTLRVDPAARTAYLGAGLMWGEVLPAAQDHGLAPLLGSSPGVGVVGYTLGGGLGWLGRKYGLATDSVLSFELVDAEGRLLCASPEENPELFWGLRGGGGSFGVITGMVIRLYPVDMVYAGNLIYPAELAKEVMARYRDWIRTAPDELTTSVVLMNFPPAPQLPEHLSGKSFVMVRGCYAGALEEGAALLETWRAWKQPLMDDFKPISFREAATISSDPVNPMPTHHSGGWMRELSDAAIDTLIEYALPHGGPPTLTITEVRHAGGAINRVEAGSGSFSRRDAELVLFTVGAAPTPEILAHVEQYAEAMKHALGPAMTGGLYMNFVHGVEARRRTKDGYSPEAYRRLQALKASLDPQDMFRYSFDMGK